MFWYVCTSAEPDGLQVPRSSRTVWGVSQSAECCSQPANTVSSPVTGRGRPFGSCGFQIGFPQFEDRGGEIWYGCSSELRSHTFCEPSKLKYVFFCFFSNLKKKTTKILHKQHLRYKSSAAKNVSVNSRQDRGFLQPTFVRGAGEGLHMGEKWVGVNVCECDENTGCWCMLRIPQVLLA